ncbi:MAG TPA: hypothetical protein VNW15_15305 [Rhizomicrobium sp.]|jgi:hypothetical protein|nr:hypothetical protein [Rhizomicrobium sp.]
MSRPMGWYVRVTTGEAVDGVYDTVLYIAGFPTPEEALAAVKTARGKPWEPCEVLEGEITANRGPQPEPGEVRLLKGAI